MATSNSGTLTWSVRCLEHIQAASPLYVHSQCTHHPYALCSTPLPLDTAAVAGTSFVGRLLALMGPSGSGKTSLLNALASHVPANSGMKLTGVQLMVWGVGLKLWG